MSYTVCYFMVNTEKWNEPKRVTFMKPHEASQNPPLNIINLAQFDPKNSMKFGTD